MNYLKLKWRQFWCSHDWKYAPSGERRRQVDQWFDLTRCRSVIFQPKMPTNNWECIKCKSTKWEWASPYFFDPNHDNNEYMWTQKRIRKYDENK